MIGLESPTFRQFTTQILTVASTTVDVRVAKGMAQSCEAMANEFVRAEFPTILILFTRAVSKLANKAHEKQSKTYCRRVDPLVKECLLFIQASLVHIAKQMKDPIDFNEAKRLKKELMKFIHNETSRFATFESPKQTEDVVRGIAGFAQDLVRRSRQTQVNMDLLKEAQIGYRHLYSDICRELEKELSWKTKVDTPGVLLDKKSVSHFKWQMTFWLSKIGGLTKNRSATCGVRYLGSSVWTEVRVQLGDEEIPKLDSALLKLKDLGPGISAVDAHVTKSGFLVLRAAIDLKLPSFMVYEIAFGSKSILVPAADVVSKMVPEVVPGKESEIDWNSILMGGMTPIAEIMGEKYDFSKLRGSATIIWRGVRVNLLADFVRGPNIVRTENFESSTYVNSDLGSGVGSVRGSVLGTIKTVGNKKTNLIDLYPVFEKFFEQSGSPEKVKDQKVKSLVFRVFGKRYALPVKSVSAYGQLNSGAWMSRTVRSKVGDVPLKDFRDLFKFSGEAGTMYIVTDSKHGRTAWAVDGIEAYETDTLALEKAKPLPLIGRSDVSKMISGIVRDHTNSPVFVLDPAYFSPMK